MKKTKFLVSGDDQDVLQKSGKYPCAVCCSGVGRNSILVSQCVLWVNKTYSGITKRMVEDPNYIYPRCTGESGPSMADPWLDVDGTMVDVEATFCCLDDPLCSGGGCYNVIAARCCAAWGKFRKLFPVLTTRHFTPKIYGKVYETYVRSTVLHGSEAW